MDSFLQDESLQQDQTKYYKLTIGDTYYKDEDLVIKVIPLDYNSDPDIYISKSEQYPNSSLDSDWQCAAYGKDTCTIHNKNISKGDVFYIGITCQIEACKYQVKILLTSEFALEDGVEFQTYLYNEEARIFKFTIPQQISDNSSVTIKASSYRGTAHSFILSATSSNDNESPSTSLQAHKGISAWKKGQVIKLNKANFEGWCQGCEIKILLDVKDQGYYHITAQTTESQPLLQSGVQVDELVGYDETQCYRYYIKNETTDVQIMLTTYSGRVNLGANPNSIPTDWETFSIRTLDNDTTELILDMRPWVRQHRGHQLTGLYYICVKGDLTATYALKLKEFVQNFQEVVEIQDGYSEYFPARPNSMSKLLYHVPQLEYTGEDIKVTFILTRKRGNADLVLAAAMCSTNNTEECANQATMELVMQKNSKYQKATTDGQGYKLVIDHNETLCKNELQGNCYYLVLVVNPQETSRALYKIVGSHSQNNHILLQESIPYVDSTDMHTFKYYSFSIVDDTQITNLTFEITPLHGDSDIFISRTNKFPTKDEYDRKSQRIGSLVDHIEFSKEDGNSTNISLAGTYYIGIFGYSYASYSILTTVLRKDLTQEDKIRQKATNIYEGYPITKTLHNELDMFIAHFEVDIPEGEDLALIIDVQNIQAKTRTYIKFGETPNAQDYDFKLGEGVLTINPSDTGYHRQGSYFVMTFPDFNFLDLFVDNYYTFTIQWRLQNTLPHLNSQSLLQVSTKPYSYSYLRHYVQDLADIRISLLSKGHQDVYVSLHPKNKAPTNETYDFTTKFMKGGNYSNGKSLLLPMPLLQQNNQACVDLGYAEEDPCVLYIGIYCQESFDCSSEIELDYESKTPKRIYSGQMKHSVMTQESQNYYYFSVTKESVGDIFAILQPLSGDADLFVNVYKVNKTTDDLEWKLPSESENSFQSKTKLNQEMIRISKDALLKECGFSVIINADQPLTRNDEECVIIFGVIPSADNAAGKETLYNFVMYKNVMELKNMIPAYGFVEEGDFAYFIYKETCDECNMILSLSSYQNGDPDIYITKGTRLPTTTDYDIKRSTLHSEVISLNLKSDYYIAHNLTSMQDHYIIGIYGARNTTFQLTVTSQEEQISTITSGLALKHSQKPYNIAYYQYYHFTDMDILISLTVSQGACDVYVSTFNTTSDNFLDKLPDKKDDATWVVEDINSINDVEGKEILVLQKDQYYCVDCYYVIGVVTHEHKAQYSIQLNDIEAEKNYTHLLRLGVPKNIKLRGQGRGQIFQFMLESNAPAQIIPTIISGQIKIFASFSEDKEQAFATQTNAQPIAIVGERIQTEQTYYIFVESITENAELTLAVHQNSTIITLHDGVPQLLQYDSYSDKSKFMLFNLPTGNTTVVISCRSKTEKFFPILLVHQFNHSDSNLTFPPSELIKYDVFKYWNEDMYLLKVTKQFTNLPDDAGLALNLHYYNDWEMTNRWDPKSMDTSAQAFITVSQSRIMKLVPNEDFFGELGAGTYKFQLFKIEPPKGKAVLITFSRCLGLTQFGVVQDPGQLNKRVSLDTKDRFGSQVVLLKNLEGIYYIIVETFNEAYDDSGNKEYLIKVEYVNQTYQIENEVYVPQNGGHIEFDYIREKDNNVKLKWGPLYKYNFGQDNEQAFNTRYKLVFSENPNAILSSACAITRGSQVYSIYESSDATTQFKTHLDPNKETQFNVIAVIDREQRVIPYKPITLKVPQRPAYGGRLLILLLAIVVMIFGALALFFFVRGRKLHKRLQEEIRDVAADEGSQTYHRVTGSNATSNDF